MPAPESMRRPEPSSAPEDGDKLQRHEVVRPDAEREVQEDLGAELRERYLSEGEREQLERCVLEPRTREADRIAQWLRDVDVERTYRDDAYYALMFGGEPGFTRLGRSKDHEETKHALIERIVLEKEAKLRGTQRAMHALGFVRDYAGVLLMRAPDRPQDLGDPVDETIAHALVTGYETASWLANPAQQTEALGRVIADSYRLLGRVPELEITPGDLAAAEQLIAPPPLPPEAIEEMELEAEIEALEAQRATTQNVEELERRIGSLRTLLRLAQLDTGEAAPVEQSHSPEEFSLASPEMQGAFDRWQEEQANASPEVLYPPASLEMQGAFDRWQEAHGEAARAVRPVGEPSRGGDAEIIFEEPVFEDGSRVQSEAVPHAVPGHAVETSAPEVGPALPQEVVRRAREVFEAQAAAPERAPSKLRTIVGSIANSVVGELKHLGRSLVTPRWWKERAKGLATAGTLEFFHFFSYGRAARKEAKEIDSAFSDLLDIDPTLSIGERTKRIDAIIDESEGRMMKHLVGYKDEFGDWVLEVERLDAFRAELRQRLEGLHARQEDVNRKQFRDMILRTFDPGWYRRGRWGVMELGLVVNGIALATKPLFSSGEPATLPPPAPHGKVTIGPIEVHPVAGVEALPPPSGTEMSGTVWDTVRHMFPDASPAQLRDGVRTVMEQNHIWDPTPGWTGPGHEWHYEHIRRLEELVRGGQLKASQLIDATRMRDGFPLQLPEKLFEIMRGVGGVVPSAAPSV